MDTDADAVDDDYRQQQHHDKAAYHAELLAHRGTYWQFWNDRLHASGWTIDGSDPNNFNQLDTLEDKS